MSSQKTACFSGYRPEKFNFPLSVEESEYLQLLKSIRQAILTAVDDGYDNFLVGMAAGFDLIAASVFYELKEADCIPKDISLTAVLPFAGHHPGRDWLERHRDVLEEADEVLTVAEKYSPQALLARNRFMVDRSSRLICYYGGRPGGTAYTVRYARKNGLEIVNVAEGEEGWPSFGG